MSNVNHKSVKQRISEKIKASHITNRLQEFSLSGVFDLETDPENEEEYNDKKKEWQKKQMTGPQVTAAFKLLGKVVPDLKQVEFDGKVEQVITQITRKIVKPKPASS